jgi:phosphoglycerate kinase
VLQAMLENRQAFSVVGGGESLTALEQAGAMDKVGFVSTGGGAMLEFLADEPMPGVEVLRG